MTEEINQAMSMDISALKDKRQSISRKITRIHDNMEKYQTILDKRERIEKTVRELEDVWEICFEEERNQGLSDKYDLGKQVIDNLVEKVNDVDNRYKSAEKELEKSARDLKKVNEMLSAVRANGK
jgi:predicted  nucleic acid-binding Zn-ribbon protein